MKSFLAVILGNRKALVGLIIVGLIVFAALFAPLLTQFEPLKRLGRPHEAPGREDDLGFLRQPPPRTHRGSRCRVGTKAGRVDAVRDRDQPRRVGAQMLRADPQILAARGDHRRAPKGRPRCVAHQGVTLCDVDVRAVQADDERAIARHFVR